MVRGAAKVPDSAWCKENVRRSEEEFAVSYHSEIFLTLTQS